MTKDSLSEWSTLLHTIDCCGMLQNAMECYGMLHNVTGCYGSNDTECYEILHIAT